ncbi:MAG TPA: deoxyribose-phosphate aldolase [Acidimicrobiales bacterium]|nr:deoxyribose-phosphate aldolase [Acidimicrobiales bacterium]
MASVDRTAVARMIDHTLLAPEATVERVQALCAEAKELGVGAVCVSPNQVVTAATALRGSAVGLASVIGFPSGAHRAEVKAAEAAAAVADGATELDMVVPLGAVVAGDWAVVEAHLRAVRDAAAPPVVLKVIVESAALDDAQLDRVCAVAVDAGADYVKTSTGFHPSGGASVEAVRRMRAAVGWDIGVKASGGIRDAATALAMIEAGATRIGASSSAAILDGI